MKASPDCKLPDYCECGERGVLARTRCAIPDINAEARSQGWPEPYPEVNWPEDQRAAFSGLSVRSRAQIKVLWAQGAKVTFNGGVFQVEVGG